MELKRTQAQLLSQLRHLHVNDVILSSSRSQAGVEMQFQVYS